MFDGDKLIDYGVENLGDSKTTYEDVLLSARLFIKRLIEETQANMVVLEGVQYQSNQMTYRKLSMLLGAIICLFKEINILFEVVPASKWKSFCGIKGQKRVEQKQNAMSFVKETYGIDVSSDEADAICCGFYIVNNINIDK